MERPSSAFGYPRGIFPAAPAKEGRRRTEEPKASSFDRLRMRPSTAASAALILSLSKDEGVARPAPELRHDL
jgi:hypothetical protein